MIQNMSNHKHLAQMQELNISSHKEKNQLKTHQFLDSKEISRINENQDSLTISQEAKDEYYREVARIETGIELRNAEGIITKLYPGLSLSGKSLNGEYDNIFNENAASQYQVFSEFLKETGAYDRMSKEQIDEFNDILKSITSGLDTINGRDGYIDLDTESAFMIASSTMALQYFNENFVPEIARDGFNDLINEYEHFNVNGRKNLLEKMALAPMKITQKITTTYTKNGKSYTHVIYDPEQDTQEYMTREEIIASTKEKYNNETIYFKEQFDSLKNNLNLNQLTETLKNTREKFVEYDSRGRSDRMYAAKKSANQSTLEASKYWSHLMKDKNI